MSLCLWLGKVRTAESSANGGLYPGGISHTVSLTNTPVSGVQLQPLFAIPDVVVNLDSNAVTVGQQKHLKLHTVLLVMCRFLFLNCAN
jgi:hypothetical protein